MSDYPYPHVSAGIEYAEAITADEITACKWVKLACQRHLSDLERSADDQSYPWRFDPDKAERVCRFAERLPHIKGKWASKRERILLEPWQRFLLTCVFGWVHCDTGLRRFREAYIEVPRKNGKSIVAAAIGIYMLCADGEFGAEVYSGATSEKQAWEVFRPARLIAVRTPDLRERFGITINAASLYRESDGSRFEPLIGSPGDGASPSCALVDEYHEHATPELYDTMTTGMGAREQPLTLIITTAGSNIAGPCYDRRNYVLKLLQGVIEDDAVFGIVYSIDEGDDWASESALRKANPNFGVSVSADYLLGRLRTALQSATVQQTFKTKHLNIWGGAQNAWMNMQAWMSCPPRKSLEELAGRECFMALDLASKIDVAALMLLFPPTGDDPLWHLHGRYYLPEDVIEEKATANYSHYAAWAKEGHLTLTPGNVIDYDWIMDDMRDLATRVEVIEAPYDPWQATHLASTMLDESMPMVEIRATVGNFSEPMKELEKLVLSKKIAHGNCPVLAWMASNVVAKLDRKDNIYPNKEKPENKIDGIVGAIMALNRALAHQHDASGNVGCMVI